MAEFDRTFVVLVGGMRSRETNPPPGETPLGINRDFYTFVGRCLPGATIIAPDCKLGFWSFETPEKVAENLCAHITRAYESAQKRQTFDRVLLLGFSSGGLVLRRALTLAHGFDRAGHATGTPMPWADKIERVIYLSSILRGWSVSSATPLGYRIAYGLFQYSTRIFSLIPSHENRIFGFLARDGFGHFGLAVQQNQPFVVETQLQQSELDRKLDAAGTSPEVIHVLGARDEFISPLDCLDPVPRSDHLFVELPGTSHKDMAQIELAAPDTLLAKLSGIGKPPAKGAGEDDDNARENRSDALRIILSAPDTQSIRQDLPTEVVSNDDINDYYDELDRPPNAPRGRSTASEVSHAVMVLHGIRDHGFWTKRIAKELKTHQKSRDVADGRTEPVFLRAPSPSYGYFNLIDFVRWSRRQRQAKWFMQQYADVRACYPNAEISFVGHSNGTYLAGRAMKYSKAIRFRNIYFAGSVLPTDFDWDQHKDQIGGKVLNVRGSRDSVVAFLPGGIEGLRLSWMFGVGGAGYKGFTRPDAASEDASVPVTERRLTGGHRAGVEENVWPKIARFIIDTEVFEPQQVEEAWWAPVARHAAWVAPAVILASIAAVLAFALCHSLSTAIVTLLVLVLIALQI